MNSCTNCSKETSNPHFCSKSCSTSYHNRRENGRTSGKQKKTVLCGLCNQPVKESRRKYCSECHLVSKVKIGNRIADITTARKRDFLTNDTQRYRRIRGHARSVAKQAGLLDQCMLCGYSAHVECAHVKAIKDFPDETLITEINNPGNLAGLCPNHHWEFENGLITLETVVLSN